MMLALNVQLLADFETIFIEKKAITIDRKIQNLIKHLHLPIVISTHQNQKYTDSRIAKQGGSYFKIVSKKNDEELVQSTRLKLMLIDKAITPIPPFTTLHIEDSYENLKPRYGATYPNATDKKKAQKHISALLSDAKWVKITDGYIANNDWNSNKDLIDTLVPHDKKLDLTIVTNNFTQTSDLEAICNNWNVKAPQFPSNIHDRYIETDKVKILLSSGLFHLSSESNKDFTYIIELK